MCMPRAPGDADVQARVSCVECLCDELMGEVKRREMLVNKTRGDGVKRFSICGSSIRGYFFFPHTKHCSPMRHIRTLSCCKKPRAMPVRLYLPR